MTNPVRIKVYVVSYGKHRNLVLEWKDAAGDRHTRTSGTKKRRDASIKAAQLEGDFNDNPELALNLGIDETDPAEKADDQQNEAFVNGLIKWEPFYDLYDTRELLGMDAATRKWHRSKLNVLTQKLHPKRLDVLTAPELSRYIGILRQNGRSEETIRGHLIALKCMLEWAVKQGYIPVVPDLPTAKIRSRKRKPKGRDLTFWEFVRMLRAVALIVKPHQIQSWRDFLIGLWISGLRIGEAAVLSWDDPLGIRINLRGQFPVMEIDSEDDKGRECRLLPITPDFHRWLMRTPKANRMGPIFRPIGERGDVIRNETNLSRTISEIGEAAKIIVNHRGKKKKYASAHDLRRTFGTRWAKIVEREVLQQLMRHADISTTNTYYVGESAQATAANVWRAVQSNTTLRTTQAR